MPTPARDRLAQLLAGTEPARTDSAALQLPGDALEVEVAGLGPVETPIGSAEAKRLIRVARPAQFGRGEQTLSDASVRDTWEIPADQVRIGGPRWESLLRGALEHFYDELGLPIGGQLRTELHSMLVYGKGQFFLPHQDSEKHDEMVGTLVVMLPSVHTGGELVIDDGGHEQTYRGSRDELVLVAFYADRRHEVRPVRSGFRVTLTFNLLLTSSPEISAGSPVPEASTYLTDHFTTNAVSPYGGRDLGTPRRLAFLLDHQYTRRGLTAGRLKGADAERVATLRAAADRADCECVLASAEIKQTWDAEPIYYSRRRRRYDIEDEQSAGDDDEYELNDLMDEEIALTWWTADDEGETINLSLERHEVCAITPTVSLKPYESEYEGYMGNYGNTLDRWYHRAAVVVWPKATSFAARAEAGRTWALRSLLDRVEAGDLDGTRADALSMEPFWRNVDAALLEPALRVAVRLGEATAARVLLAPFRVEMLTTEHSPLLASVATEYGDSWLLELMSSWEASNRFAGSGRLTWVTETLVPLCRALRDLDVNPVADGFAGLIWHWLSSQVDAGVTRTNPKDRQSILAGLAVPVARALEAASDELGATIASTLRESGDAVVELLVPALRAVRSPLTTACRAISDDCRSRLARIVDRPARASDDWSIAWSGCGCQECARLEAFLGAPSERTHEWPLAEAGRAHVHQKIDTAGLPVRHLTRRQGRPYTLVLTKTEDLFRGETHERDQARRDLGWLRSTFQ